MNSTTPEYSHFEAVVVGSGFGGAVTACRLVEAGVNTCILERGRRYEAGDFPDVPPDRGVIPDPARWIWGHDQGLWDIHDLREMQAVGAAGFGGGSLIYANVHLRAPEEVFAGWPVSRAALDPYYDLVSYMLDLQSIDELAGDLPIKTRQFDDAAAALGRSTIHPPLSIHFHDHGGGLPPTGMNPCSACGACSSGCGYRSKNSLDHNYLQLAEHPEGNGSGAEVRTLCEVTRIWCPGHAESPLAAALVASHWAVEYLDHSSGGDRVIVGAAALFLCAGAINDSELLLRNRGRLTAVTHPAATLPRLDGVGAGYFPNADTPAVVYDTKNPQHPDWGPTITTAMGYYDPEQEDWFVFEDGGYDAAFKRLFHALKAPMWLDRNRYSERDGFPDDEAPPDPDGRQPTGTRLRVIAPATGAAPPHRKPPAVADELHTTPRRLADAVLGAGAETDPPAVPWLIPKLPTVLTHAVFDDLREQAMEAAFAQALPVAAETRRRVLESTVRGFLGWLGWWPGLQRGLQSAGERTGAWFMDRRPGLKVEDLAHTAVDTAVEVVGLDAPVELASRALPWVLGYEEDRTTSSSGDRVQLLLVMGRDDGPWRLMLDAENDRLVASAGERGSAQRAKTLGLYEVQTRLMRDVAATLGGELRTNPLWDFARKPMTVHSAGGCAMGGADEYCPCDAYGRVRGTRGLYVNDGALFPSSVGVNPSHTIAALAERNIQEILRSDLGKVGFIPRQWGRAAQWVEWAKGRGLVLELPTGRTPPPVARPIGIRFEERMTGFFAVASGRPVDPIASRREHMRACLAAENLGRASGQSITMSLDVTIRSLAQFLEHGVHEAQFTGSISLTLTPGGARIRARVTRGALRVLPALQPVPRNLHIMSYSLAFEVDGKEWTLDGWKYMEDDPGPDLWGDTTALFVHLRSPGEAWIGTMRLGMSDLLERMLPSIRVIGTRDTRRIAWTMARFLVFFGHGLKSVYLPVAVRDFMRDVVEELRHG